MANTLVTLIKQQLTEFKKLGFNVKVSGSFLLREMDHYSDIDLKCYVRDPLASCKVVHKYFNYVFPYHKYRNKHRPNEIMCNMKFYLPDPNNPEKQHRFDLTFLPSSYEGLHTAIEQFRFVHHQSQATRSYLKRKRHINMQIYVCGTLTDRQKQVECLRKLKYNYFHQFIKLFCRANNLDYEKVKTFYEFEHIGGYVGTIKIK
jgi:hypothetical protein